MSKFKFCFVKIFTLEIEFVGGWLNLLRTYKHNHNDLTGRHKKIPIHKCIGSCGKLLVFNTKQLQTDEKALIRLFRQYITL